MPPVELRSTQVEYRGSPVPLIFPQNLQTQIEYVFQPLTTGILQEGIVTTVFSRAAVAGVALTAQITPADLLAYVEVSGNTNFDAEAKWRYIIAQYLHRDSGQIFNIIHRDAGALWVGVLTFTTNSALGIWDKRSMIIHALTGVELILLPTRFFDGESLVLNA